MLFKYCHIQIHYHYLHHSLFLVVTSQFKQKEKAQSIMAPNTTFDADFLGYAAAHPHLAPVSGPPNDVQDMRDRTNAYITKCALQFPMSENIIETKHAVSSHDGVDISVHEFSRKDWAPSIEPQPAILYIHGGGLVACPVDTVCRPLMARFATDSGLRTFGVDYRLAPEHPYPTPAEDCYAALQWIVKNAAVLKVDPGRIGLFGTSAGALLAASVSLLARDRAFSPPIAKQILIYPMLDDRSSVTHFNPLSARDQSFKNWITSMDMCWDSYIGADKRGKSDADVSPYAVPARATDLAGLPSTYIDIGSLDWFRDEALEFSAKLAKADVEVELHLYTGLPHCFDIIAPTIPITISAWQNRLRAIKGI